MQTAIYTRISEDDGTALGVARQREDCEREAARRGWTVVDAYTDNDVSATRSKIRPEYQRMLADIEAGTVEGIVVWDVDRLTRTPRELEDIIDLADRRGLALASVGGDIDLGTPQGRMTARIKGTVARHETEQMSRRIRRKSDERAASGHPHGQIGYGFTRVDGRDVAHPEQSVIVREAARRILDGESLRRVAADFNERGIPGPSGKALWSTATLRQMLMRPSLAGLRQHRGQVVGDSTGDAVLDRDTHDRLVALFTDPSRRTSPGTGRAPKYLLSGIARCGRCGGTMRRLVGWTPKPESKSRKAVAPAYACADCHKVRRQQAALDAFVEELIVGRLELADAADIFTQGNPAAVAEARDAIAAIDARLATAADAFADGAIDGSQLTRITARLREERTAHEVALTKAMPPAIPPHLVGDRAREVWASLDIDRRRAVLTTLLDVTVLPGGVGRSFDSTLIQTTWKDGSR
ncbi:recombinase family protein [Microbacterium sp. P5_E9]